MNTLLFTVFLSLLLWPNLIIGGSLYAREPLYRYYYTLYIPSGNSVAAEHTAHILDARYEGPVGELRQYYEISFLKPYKHRRRSLHSLIPQQHKHNHDTLIVKRFQQLKQQSHLDKRQLKYIALVDSLKPQTPRRRLVKRAPPPPSLPQIPSPAATTATDTQKWQDEFSQDEVDQNIIDAAFAKAPIAAQDFLKLPGGFQSLKKILAIDDPGFDRQWHLVNQEEYGHDLNVTGVWHQGITGKDIVVAILDDGLDMDSDDLKTNFFAEGSYDFNDHTALPKPKLSDDTHGTRCAGEIAAVKNGICGVGTAYDAKVAGIRILSADITDEDEATALNYKFQENHIYSCSWGPSDTGDVAEAPQGIVLDAIKNGINHGRNGTGSIFVFASGNGGGNDDNCNFDGYTNSIYTITVGAVDRKGNHPYYSEKCSAQLVVTYSSGSGGNIYTTDIGQNQCTDRHGGTSAAAPLAAGVFALVLSVRPDLTWRDMQYLCVETAIPLSLEDSDWTLLPSGRMYNHKFGYGKLDAYSIVEAAKNFDKVGPQTYLQISSPQEKRPIPDRSATIGNVEDLTDTITITQEMVDQAGLARLEHVTAKVYIEHTRRGDLEVLLESPHNISSQLGVPRKYDVSAEGLIDWTFMTVKHWDEDPVGQWTLRIIDWKNSQFTGTFTNWTLTLWGEMVEETDGEIVHVPGSASIAMPLDTSLFNNNEEEDDDDDEKEQQQQEEEEEEKLNPPSSPLATASTQEKNTPISQTSQPLILSTPSPSIPILPISANSVSISKPATISSTVMLSVPTVSVNKISEGNDNSTLTGFDSENNGLHSKTTEGTSASYYFFVAIVGLTAAGLSWIVRRRIKGPGSAKDFTAYTNVSQVQGQRDMLVYEFDLLNQGRRLQRMSESNDEDKGNSYNDEVSQSFMLPAEASGRQSTNYTMKRQ